MKYIYCHPLFDERKCSHRFSFQLSKTFKQNGLHLDRFDYKGTGEASGKFCDITLDSLRHDIELEMDDNETVLIGLRFGASLAFSCCCHQQSSVTKLIQIEPILDGQLYVDYLFRKQRLKDTMTKKDGRFIKDEGFYNLEGYKTSENLIEQMKLISLKHMSRNLSVGKSVRFASVAPVGNPDKGLISTVESLKELNIDSAIHNFSLPCFWERVPDVDYTVLTETIVRWCCD